MYRILAIVMVLIVVSTATATIVYPPVKYGQQVTIYFELYGATDANTAYGTAPAADDVYISKDGGALARATNAVTDLGRFMSLVLTATEMQAATVCIDVNDETSPKAYGDELIVVPTFGHASALQAFDLDDANPIVDVNAWSLDPVTMATVFSDPATSEEQAAALVAALATTTTQVNTIATDTGTTLPALIGTPVASVSGDIATVLTAAQAAQTAGEKLDTASELRTLLTGGNVEVATEPNLTTAAASALAAKTAAEKIDTNTELRTLLVGSDAALPSATDVNDVEVKVDTLTTNVAAIDPNSMLSAPLADYNTTGTFGWLINRIWSKLQSLL